jgi:hypothetical protein
MRPLSDPATQHKLTRLPLSPVRWFVPTGSAIESPSVCGVAQGKVGGRPVGGSGAGLTQAGAQGARPVTSPVRPVGGQQPGVTSPGAGKPPRGSPGQQSRWGWLTEGHGRGFASCRDTIEIGTCHLRFGAVHLMRPTASRDLCPLLIGMLVLCKLARPPIIPALVSAGVCGCIWSTHRHIGVVQTCGPTYHLA